MGVHHAPSHLLFTHSGLVQTKTESGQLFSGSSVRLCALWRHIRRKVDTSPESLGKNKKSIWEYYNEMAEVEDNIREVEWRDLADTILIFVRMSTLYDASLC